MDSLNNTLEELPQSDNLLDLLSSNSIEPIPNNTSRFNTIEEISRFNGASWYEDIIKTKVTVAGIGGIGSYVAFLLARLNINNMTVFDPDTLESGNLSGQLFFRHSVGKSKVLALQDVLSNLTVFRRVSFYQSPFTSSTSTSAYLFCGFDNMAARKEAYENWKSHNFIQGLFIDGRLSAEDAQIFCIRAGDKYRMDEYEKEYLFDSSQAEPTVCSFKQTSFMANLIGSFIVNIFINYVANIGINPPIMPHDVPFYTLYSSNTMYFKTIS